MSEPSLNQRRQLRFKSIDDITSDAGALAQAERNNKLRQLGNWTLGQACGHLAAWINYGYEGPPVKLPWIVKMLARASRKKYLYKGMNPGGRLPRVPGGTLAIEKLSTEEGLDRLRRACARLKSGTPTRKNFVFGRLTPDEWNNLEMRHAELHLSFFRTD